MQRIQVLDTPLISMWVYPDRKMVHHVMKAYCYGPDFRSALNKGTEAIETYKATKWLSDDRLTGPVPKEDEEWANNDWLPRTKLAGWRHWAIVPPEKVIGHIKIERIAKGYAELGINMRMFSDPTDAMKWLDSL